MFGDEDEGPNLPPPLPFGVPMEESDRSMRMRRYFEKEAVEIVDRFVERNKHDFAVKDLQPRLKEYNTIRLSKPLTPSRNQKLSSTGALLSDRPISGHSGTTTTTTTTTSSKSSKTVLYAAEESQCDSSSKRGGGNAAGSLTAVLHEPRVNTLDLFAENYKLMKPTTKKKKSINKYSNRVIIEYKYPKNINDNHLKWLVEGEDD